MLGNKKTGYREGNMTEDIAKVLSFEIKKELREI